MPTPLASCAPARATQDLSIKVILQHTQLTDEEAPTGFLISGDAKPTASANAGGGDVAADAPSAAGGKRGLDDSTAATADAKKARADDDGAICLD